MRYSTTEERLLTIEEFQRLPDDGTRLELIRGRVVREPPAGFEHGDLGMGIATRLRTFVKERGLGTVVGPDTGFILAEDPPTVRAPDAAFVRAGKIEAGRPLGFAPFAPDLAVEIVSPSNTLGEIHEKVLDYLDAGTALVWVVEPRGPRVTTYRSRSEIQILGPGDELDAADVVPGFRIGVRALFEG